MRGYRKSVYIIVVLLLAVLGVLAVRGLRGTGGSERELEMGREQEIVGWNVSGLAVSGGSSEGVAKGSPGAGKAADMQEQERTNEKKERAGGTISPAKNSPAKTSAPTEKAGKKSSGKREDGKKDREKEREKDQESGSEKGRTKSTGKPAKSSGPSGETSYPDRTESPEVKGETEKTEPLQHVSIRISCRAILSHRDLWKSGLETIIPEDGIFYDGEYTWREGLTVYDVLRAVCDAEDIALDSQFTLIYGTYYIRGIGNLYEFDCGSGSGWKYSVNSDMPGVGCSGYKLKAGDMIEFFYDYQI